MSLAAIKNCITCACGTVGDQGKPIVGLYTSAKVIWNLHYCLSLREACAMLVMRIPTQSTPAASCGPQIPHS